MEKHKLLALVKKTAPYFDDYTSPNSVYQSLWFDKHFKPLLNKMSAEDIIFYSFLIPINNNGQDIDEAYDKIETDMFAVELVEIYNTEPEVDCPECHNGFEPCDNCDGTGEVECDRCDNTGQVDCSYCDGSGEDDEGATCDSCQGIGKENCDYCYGSGQETCNYCGGDGDVTCGSCEGTGNFLNEDESEIENIEYISWNSSWKGYFFIKKPDEQIDEEDAKNFGLNSKTIRMGTTTEITGNYEGYENGDTILYVTREKEDIRLKRTSDRVIL
jgi:hypothetical protein